MPGKTKDELLLDHNKDGIDRRGFLKCMARCRGLELSASCRAVYLSVTALVRYPRWEAKQWERVSVNAPGSGLHHYCADLACVLDPLACAASSRRILAKVPPALEAIALLLMGLPGHLDGFLSGVNGPG